MFDKYSIYPLGKVWGISERKLVFFRKPLTFDKVLLEPCAIPTEVAKIISKERLTFNTHEEAEDEIDRLYFGEKPISRKIYLNGALRRIEHS